MPLAYTVQQPLVIPDDAFNANDVAILVVTGGRYGGQWALNAIPTKGTKSGDPVGKILLPNPDGRPDMAVEIAVVWVNDACVKAEWKLATWKNKNSEYGPDEAPFLASAVFIIDRR